MRDYSVHLESIRGDKWEHGDGRQGRSPLSEDPDSTYYPSLPFKFCYPPSRCRSELRQDVSTCIKHLDLFVHEIKCILPRNKSHSSGASGEFTSDHTVFANRLVNRRAC